MGRGTSKAGAGNSIVSKTTGDTVTLDGAFNSWIRNATGIKNASRGDTYANNPNKVGLNDEAKATLLTNYVTGHEVRTPLFRGLENVTDADYKKYTTVGTTVKESGLSSWTTAQATASGHAKNGTGIVFKKESKTKDARRVTSKWTGLENEVIGKDVAGVVTKVEKKKYYTLVYLK